MNSNMIFEWLGEFILWTTAILFENVGNTFNNLVILLGFFGLFYWLRLQKKYNDKAAQNPEQRK